MKQWRGYSSLIFTGQQHQQQHHDDHHDDHEDDNLTLTTRTMELSQYHDSILLLLLLLLLVEELYGECLT
jgi:hypothetical protein